MQYEIKTLEDIVNIVNEENGQRFLSDFKEWLAFNIHVRKISKEMKSIEIAKIDNIGKSMTWVDDGKTGLSRVVVCFESEE